ncbi:MAG: TonB-dependent receptor [Cyclobacteriaceae bacterium]
MKRLTTKEKALEVNLNDRIYGTLAEIGGGQEVAAWFFKAGGASGTIAKTMSAYDMTFSDAIYGKTRKYVCKEKLMKMLDREYTLLSHRLAGRAKRTTFFAFANTVEVLNYKKTNNGHGWIGLRFQLHPNSEPNDCIIHVVLHDNDANWQQQVLGMIGVNLLFACFSYKDPEDIINSLTDNLSTGRVEVDMFSLSGPDFHHVDNRLMSLLLVKNGLTQATLFGPKGNVLLPSESLYKKNVLILRGRFRPVTHVNVDMMISGMKQFRDDPEVSKESLFILAELTLNDLSMKEGEIDVTDFLDRVDLLCSLGQNVLISNYKRHYRLSGYISKFTRKRKLALIVGYNNLKTIFEEKHYEDLDGGILEAFSRLFGTNSQLLVYPALDNETKDLSTAANFKPDANLKPLYEYFRQNKKIVDLKNAKTENLHIVSDHVLDMIVKDEDGWDEFVPTRVSCLIRQNYMFNYPAPLSVDDEDLFNI